MRIRRHNFAKPLLVSVAAVYVSAFVIWLLWNVHSPLDWFFGAVSFLCVGTVGGRMAWRFMRERGREEMYRLELWHKEEVFSTLFESTPIAITIIDASGLLIRSNPAAKRISGHPDSAGISFMEFVHPAHVDEAKERFRQTANGHVQNFRTVILLSGGGLADVEVTSIPIQDDGGNVTVIIAMYEDVTRKLHTEERVKHMAYYDDLTGLPNRRLFRDMTAERLATAGEQARLFVVLVNVDRFKVVTGSLGQDIGDILLLQLADRLHRSVADHGVAARLEGDEFGLLIYDDSGTLFPDDLAKRVNRELEAPFTIQEYVLHLTTSMGIAVGTFGGEESELIRNAGIALSKAKEKGKNSCVLYSPELDDVYLSKLTMENDLRKAIQCQEFLLMYQPQVHIETGELVGMEALIRWRHPERGLVPPGKFIPLAEETGLIVPIGEWVLREACRQNAEWQRQGLPAIPVSVNLSVRQFLQPDLAELISAILSETGLLPSYLELEVTESMTMDVEFSSSTLMRLKQLGIQISIDDFGTGYSSLNYLKNFPVDKLKIDQSFVRDIMVDPNDAAIVRTIITMAHFMNQRVIAEGVETPEQLDYLRTYRCDEMQGYLCSPPIEAGAFRDRLAAWKEAAAANESDGAPFPE